MALNAQRIADISQAMYGVIEGANGSYDAAAMAKRDKAGADEALVGKRESVLANIAGLARDQDWTHTEVIAAGNAAAQMYTGNDKAKASHVKTLVNHCKLAAHPLVRDQFASLVGMIADCVELESLMESADERPVLKLFKRRYHAIVGVMRLVTEGMTFDGPDDLTNYAEANDPDFNPKGAAVKLAAALKVLAKVNKHFPIGLIGDAISELSPIDEDRLKAAREDAQAHATSRLVNATVAPNEPRGASVTVGPVVVVSHPFTKPVTNPPAPDMSANIDAMLGDEPDMMAAD